MSKQTSILQPGAPGIVKLAGAVEFSAHGIVSRAVIATPALRVTLFGFSAGQELTEHASSSRALIQILSGSSAWTIAGVKHELHAGEMLHLPPGTPHAVHALEPFSMLLTLVREETPVARPSA